MDMFMASCLNETSSASYPNAPLLKKAFCKVQFNHRRTLRIGKPGSDFCDTCTNLTNTANSESNDTLRN